MNEDILTDALRRRLVVLFKEILALNLVKDFDPPLTFNRVSGAVHHELLREENRGLSEDALVDKAVDLSQGEKLKGLLAGYDAALKQRAAAANRQTFGIVNNLVPADMENRDQVIADTLDMLERFRLVKSIPGIKTLVKARMENQNRDLDELDYLHLR
jgi:hypothetical protein